MTGHAALSSLSICPERAFMPSASRMSGQRTFSSSQRISASVSAPRPRPGPARQTSQFSSRYFSRAVTAGSCPSMRPLWAASGKGMASAHFTASMG